MNGWYEIGLLHESGSSTSVEWGFINPDSPQWSWVNPTEQARKHRSSSGFRTTKPSTPHCKNACSTKCNPLRHPTRTTHGGRWDRGGEDAVNSRSRGGRWEVGGERSRCVRAAGAGIAFSSSLHRSHVDSLLRTLQPRCSSPSPLPPRSRPPDVCGAPCVEPGP
jgi:hypothetical protein